ncbi:hemerythrin domain-containing protein [Streptacidiphilus sp. N1-3]|uniref:Hemerythrin domain-containing protein n=1 Tax=Streptacidiphilus alkalitolerans TaxID=3342712 RepID=A0ABV6X800_9ACTN
MADTIDFTMMYVTHNAFRRDLGRLTAAAAEERPDTGRIRGGWENFKQQLHIHHTVEDTDLWPRLHRAVTSADDLALLEQMEAEHALIDPLLAAVDKAMDKAMDKAKDGRRADLADCLDQLSEALVHHLEHEEAQALPLIQAVLTPADWRAFANAMRSRQGVRGAAVYVPWILDGAAPAEQRRFLGALPAPVTVLNRLLWQRSYRRRQLWGSASATGPAPGRARAASSGPGGDQR